MPGLPEGMIAIDDEELTQIPQIQTPPTPQSKIWTVGVILISIPFVTYPILLIRIY